jgi:hypothetical protein
MIDTVMAEGTILYVKVFIRLFLYYIALPFLVTIYYDIYLILL